MIKDRRAHLARLNRMIAMADIVKISDEDVAWMTGKDDVAGRRPQMAEARREDRRRHPRRQGRRGLHGALMRIARPAVKVKVADTVGAGDTFTAGLLTALRGRSC